MSTIEDHAALGVHPLELPDNDVRLWFADPYECEDPEPAVAAGSCPQERLAGSGQLPVTGAS